MSDTLRGLLELAASEAKDAAPGLAMRLAEVAVAVDEFVESWAAAPAVGAFIAEACAQIAGGGVENFVTTSVVDDEGNVRGVVTVQKPDGKTPLEFCADAARERDEARAEVERLRAAIAGATTWAVNAVGYSGGHRGEMLEAFEHGMGTAANDVRGWARRVLAGGEA